MSMLTFKNNFQCLIHELDCDKKSKKIIKRILDKLISYDVNQKTRFEYSLQIEKGSLNKEVRFVNYDNYNLQPDPALYLKRLALIENIVFSCYKRSLSLTKLFEVVLKLKTLSLPWYLGVETRNKKNVFLKFYFNLFSLSNKVDAKCMLSLLNDILKPLKFQPKIKEAKIALLGLSVNKAGNPAQYKLYYLFDKKSKLKNDKFFSKEEIRIFNWLNLRNKLPYFDIMERFDSKKLISKKLEVHPKYSKYFLKNLFTLTHNKSLLPRIERIIELTKGEIEAISLEKSKITIYVTMLSYGKKN